MPEVISPCPACGGITVDAMKLINNLCEGYNAAADEPAMQELKPLPCPLCGSKEPKVNRGCGVVTCCEISVEDVAAWNKLPRALTWTHEPPKVAGWYWVRQQGENFDLIQHYNQADIDAGFDNERRLKQWAGPIPLPLEG